MEAEGAFPGGDPEDSGVCEREGIRRMHGIGMGIGMLLGLAIWLIGVLIVAAVAYFVIKKAMKDALTEWDRERGR